VLALGASRCYWGACD